jgi:hypothetical protein
MMQTQLDRESAEFALDRWGAWRGFAGSLELRDAVVRAIAAERERCAKIADQNAALNIATLIRSAL